MMVQLKGIGRGLVPATALALLVAGAAPAPAQDKAPLRTVRSATAVTAAGDDDRGFGFGSAGGRRAARLAHRLDLSDAQRDAVEKIHEAGRARDLPLRKQMRQLRHELQGEMLKDAPSEKAVIELARRLGELRTQLQSGHLRDRLAVREQLTPEQRDRLVSMDGRGRGARGGHCRPESGPGGRRWQRNRDAD